MESEIDVRDRSIAGNEPAIWDLPGEEVDPCLNLRAATPLAIRTSGNAQGHQFK